SWLPSPARRAQTNRGPMRALGGQTPRTAGMCPPPAGRRRDTTLPPKLPVGALVEAAVEWSLDRFDVTFRAVSDGLDTAVAALQDVLLSAPPWLLIAVLAALARLVAGWGMAALVVAGLLIIDSIGLWEPTWETFSLVVV